MRIITKDIQLAIDGSPQGFRLTKPDAFSGVEILRLLFRLQDRWGEAERRDGSNVGDGSLVPRSCNCENRPLVPPSSPTVLDLITSLSTDELRSVMTSCLNHIEVLLPAGPHPVMKFCLPSELNRLRRWRVLQLISASIIHELLYTWNTATAE